MKNEELLAFEIISKAGDARSKIFEALNALQDKDESTYANLLIEAEKLLTEAHKLQFNILSRSSGDDPLEMNYLLVHAQDHLMTAMAIKDITSKMIDIIKSNEKE